MISKENSVGNLFELHPFISLKPPLVRILRDLVINYLWKTLSPILLKDKVLAWINPCIYGVQSEWRILKVDNEFEEKLPKNHSLNYPKLPRKVQGQQVYIFYPAANMRAEKLHNYRASRLWIIQDNYEDISLKGSSWPLQTWRPPRSSQGQQVYTWTSLRQFMKHLSLREAS